MPNSPRVIWPGMSKARLATALRKVALFAADNSCTCDKTGSLPRLHRRSCWTRLIASDLAILETLESSIRPKL